jgi:transcriptional regulator with XRE-family HTH domain
MIKPELLRLVRKIRELSREDLAGKARLTSKTIYRLEKGDEAKPIRQANLDRLAQALGVDPDVLTGEKPVPTDASEPSASTDGAFYQLHVRVDATVRNAFELVARRYGISLSTIVEFAPLLFDIMAGGSLKHRSTKLEAFKAALRSIEEIGTSFPHLSPPIFSGGDDQEAAIRAEERSIADRDVFGLKVPHRRTRSTTGPEGWEVFSIWDEDTENPFAAYLTMLTGDSDIAIDALGPSWTNYEVCRSDATVLAGGDEEIADWILRGEIPIQRMPRALNTAAERLEWMRENRIQVGQ